MRARAIYLVIVVGVGLDTLLWCLLCLLLCLDDLWISCLLLVDIALCLA